MTVSSSKGVTSSRAVVVRTVEEELSRGADISIVGVVSALIERAHASRASDIHVDPGRETVRVRLRVDGVLQDTCSYPKAIHNEVISRVKVLAGLRTDEHQAPQDGRFRYAIEEKDSAVDMRVSIAPTYHGENIVLRLLSDNAEHFTLEMLGFSKSDAKKIKDAIARPNGMILSTGPTGSGKTTTLYTLVKMLNAPEVSIVTIEETLPEEEVGEEIPEEEVTNSGEEEVEPSQEEVSEEEAEEEEEVEEPLEETSVSEPAPEA